MSSLLTRNLTTALATASHPRPSCTQFFSWRSIGSCRFSSLRASGTSQNYSDLNLYDLLGIDSSAEKAQIKEAYRALQKRCHPDIAGPAGHEMAIVLNEVFALLSDENSRLAYDKELAKISGFQGYTGRPIYSVWQGSENEHRAVFVDEAKCIGCLKCALFAKKTFAIESLYGRARVVAQWADPEHLIQEAIGTCPVDCISVVKRSDLAALEFIMSRLPRGRVKVGQGNSGGTRTTDVFDELEKFQARYAQHKASESETWEESRAAAINAIFSISNWLYWQSPPITVSIEKSQGKVPSIKKLRAAAEVRKLKSSPKKSDSSQAASEYWLPPSPQECKPQVQNTVPPKAKKANPEPPLEKGLKNQKLADPVNPLKLIVPTISGIMAAICVDLQPGEPMGHVKEHIGGPLALSIVNSPWSQLVLAGVTWFLIGMYLVELVEAFRSKR